MSRTANDTFAISTLFPANLQTSVGFWEKFCDVIDVAGTQLNTVSSPAFVIICLSLTLFSFRVPACREQLSSATYPGKVVTLLAVGDIRITTTLVHRHTRWSSVVCFRKLVKINRAKSGRPVVICQSFYREQYLTIHSRKRRKLHSMSARPFFKTLLPSQTIISHSSGRG